MSPFYLSIIHLKIRSEYDFNIYIQMFLIRLDMYFGRNEEECLLHYDVKGILISSRGEVSVRDGV